MAGGLRYETVADMPQGMREQVVGQILAKYAGVEPPAPQEDPCRGEDCLCWWECNGVAIENECPWRK